MSGPKANGSAITIATVQLKEIDALHDLWGGVMLADDGHPRYPAPFWSPPIYSGLRGSIGQQALHQHCFNLEDPRLKNATKTPDGWTGLPAPELRSQLKHHAGMHSAVRITGLAPCWRTFVSKNSTAISKKWVYVWAVPAQVKRSRKADGEWHVDSITLDKTKAGLAAELEFDSGKYRIVNFQSEGNRGKNRRTPTGSNRSELHLRVVAMQRTAEQTLLCYYFTLHPIQVPFLALTDKRVVQSMIDRGTRLFDWGYTLVCDNGAWEQVQPMTSGARKLKHPTFQVHLVDPFKEALKRHERLSRALDLMTLEQSRLGKQESYLLGKRIQSFTSAKKLQEVVKYQLSSELHRWEKGTAQLAIMVDRLAQDCITWLGEKQKPDTIRRIHTALSDDKGRVSGGWKNEHADDVEWANPFSQMVADYYAHGCDPEDFHDVTQLVVAASERLKESASGPTWLERNLKKSRNGAKRKADGGLGILFREAKQVDAKIGTQHKWVKGALGALAAVYSDAWVEWKQQHALSDVYEFFKQRHGIEFQTVRESTTRRVWRAKLSDARREMRRAARQYSRTGKITRLAPPPQSSFVKFGEKALIPLNIAASTLSVATALRDFNKTNDFAKLLEASNGVLETWGELIAASDKFQPKWLRARPWATAFGKSLKLSPLGVVTNAVSMGLSANDAMKASNTSIRNGHWIKTAGSALALGAALTGSSGVGVPVSAILAVMSLIVSQTGGLVVALSDDGRIFVCYCKWGKLTWKDELREVFTNESNFKSYWYNGDLRALKNSTKAQLNCLNQLVFHYELKPELVKEGELALKLEKISPQLVSWLAARDLNWQLHVTVKATHGLTRALPDPPPTEMRHLNASHLVVEQPAKKPATLRFVFPYNKEKFKDVKQVEVSGYAQLNLPKAEETVYAAQVKRDVKTGSITLTSMPAYDQLRAL